MSVDILKEFVVKISVSNDKKHDIALASARIYNHKSFRIIIRSLYKKFNTLSFAYPILKLIHQANKLLT